MEIDEETARICRLARLARRDFGHLRRSFLDLQFDAALLKDELVTEGEPDRSIRTSRGVFAELFSGVLGETLFCVEWAVSDAQRGAPLAILVVIVFPVRRNYSRFVSGIPSGVVACFCGYSPFGHLQQCKITECFDPFVIGIHIRECGHRVFRSSPSWKCFGGSEQSSRIGGPEVGRKLSGSGLHFVAS